ncbi:GyrI-like domain-containing protein [Vallitalea pronyensis]|uniref:GyrI-like domain-containing protein n=1 Tax=Vallitalea pronyensis TaxID=1348613 RepID=A0A8J8MI53_9FIRM|nr:GyrI-like domain-containing protein [Vallitalea pronyensis]QUI21886.1 GyrI-like domain-containing protein [Vallitalea pronyensis]
MSTAKNQKPQHTPEGYRPNNTPTIINMVKEIKDKQNVKEVFIEQINPHTHIVDRVETKIVGIKIVFSAESRGLPMRIGTNTDKTMAEKYISNGTIKLLSDIIKIENPEVIGVRTHIEGAGAYHLIIGIVVEDFEQLPEHLPEDTVTFVCPPCRYAKFNINERNLKHRTGYGERMMADEYFVNGFRTDTNYVYNKQGFPFYVYDDTGDVLMKYEPIKTPKSPAEKFDSTIFKVVSIPDILCACSMTPPDSEEDVIFKYFSIQNQVSKLECSYMYNDDYYGFPTNTPIKGKYNSYFGSRVSSFDGLPDTVEKMIISGGIYLHISQLEFNGDNPIMLYNIAFNHLVELFLNKNPDYEQDQSKHIFARFRQANAASIFVPLTYKSV